MKHYRQGDLLFVEICFWPELTVPMPGNVLGEGEKAGHRHVLESPGEVFMTVPGGQLVFRSHVPARIVHPEHRQLELPSGRYRVVRQREYRPNGILPSHD